ncbi:MAG: helix-turn-helix domain-containing protein [Desulfatiglandaceae bacterium]
MNKVEELNLYEILGIPLNASYFEIRQAYKEELSIYDEDSVISSAFFSDDERDGVLKKIEEAFVTLIDDNKRGKYDRALVDAGIADVSILSKKGQKKPIPLFQMGRSAEYNALVERVKKRVEEKDVTAISTEILSKEVISGNDLKRLRESIGITLEEVFEVARIRKPFLRAIEEDQFEELPPMVYLKSFLRSYAELLQVDVQKIVEGYIKNVTFDQEFGR